jgi:hypothetical protein
MMNGRSDVLFTVFMYANWKEKLIIKISRFLHVDVYVLLNVRVELSGPDNYLRIFLCVSRYALKKDSLITGRKKKLKMTCMTS